MYGQARKRRNLRAAIIVGAVTLLALAAPVGAPLYAEVYPPPPGPGDPPGPDLDAVRQALTNANLDAGFDSPEITQFETTTFTATVIYGTSTNPSLPTVKIAWSNEATLEATEDGTFDIEPTSTSRLYLDSGTRRPSGGFGLTWTWDVTPLVAGEHTLTLSILPTVIVGTKQVPALDVNEPISVSVDVHPVQDDFDEVLSAAESMETDVPDEMTVGTAYPVGASMSLAGHADTVTADIELALGAGSAAVTIVEESASASPAALLTAAASEDERIVRMWTVTPNEPGQVALVFTATVQGEVESHALTDDVQVETKARATEPGPSVWQVLQQPVQYLTPFVAFAVAVLGLWAAWKRRKSTENEESTVDGKATAKGKAPAKKEKAPAKKRKTADTGADDDERTTVGSDPAP